MKKLFRYLAVTAVVATLSLAPSAAFAGECCTKAADKAKAGKTCEKCVSDHKCCKDAVAKVTKDGKAKACAKCAAKKDAAKS